MPQEALIPHLFRTEYRKIVAVLCKHFGFAQVAIAEDIASDTFLTAAQTWGVDAVPRNPTAWLYSVAGNKAKNYLQRNQVFDRKIAPALKHEQESTYEEEIDLSPQNIADSQLQMMFAICHPAISPEAQIGLSLRILCGFGIEEIADAFLTGKTTINKRLFRAKEKLREENIRIALPGNQEIDDRLETVLTTIYLLFNEGYYSVSHNNPLRRDFCLEAIRLCTLLVENKDTNRPPVNALLALMCFHFSRFDARVDENGEMILYEDQDTNRWNADWISKGGFFLACAATGERVSKYHLEAGIAYWNTQKADTPEKWENILQLYNRLLQIDYSPIAALNRTYALAKANRNDDGLTGKKMAIMEAEKLQLEDNPLYFALLGELYTGLDNNKAARHFQQAIQLTKTASGRQVLRDKLDKLL